MGEKKKELQKFLLGTILKIKHVSLNICHQITNSEASSSDLSTVCYIYISSNTLCIRYMGGSPGELSEELVTQDKGWRMNCDVDEATEGLENELWRR